MATNVKYLKENNLFEAHKHFMRLSEAYIPTKFPEEEIEEDGEEQDQNGGMPQDPNAMGGGDPMADGNPNGGMPQDPNAMGGGDPMGGANQNAMGGDPNGGMSQDPNAMGGEDPMASADPNAMGTDPMAGADPMEAPSGDMGEDDGDTIDIDGLTKAQDKLNVKQNHIGRDLSKVDNRISTLLTPSTIS